MATRIFRILAVLLAVPLVTVLAADHPVSRAAILEIDGAIGPATSDYVVRGLETAAEDNYDLVILRIDTPGGLVTSMREIIKAILASPIPVASYVSPEGSRAASAGTYILYASHIAAMSPATNLGAATPVSIGGGGPSLPSLPGQDKKNKEKPDGDTEPGSEAESGEETEAEPAPDDTAMQRKVLYDSIAYIRSLAEKRGRNADWAELAVREGVSLGAREALEQNIVDFVANDLDELMQQIDGREIDLDGHTVTLQTEDVRFSELAPDWRTKLLEVITDPQIAYILLLIGIYGLMFEGYNPGALVPGVIGGICLLLGLFALQVLPVNYAGLALIALGVILMTAEVFAPSFGVLGIGGIVSFVIGSVILLDTDVPGLGVSSGIIGATAAVGATLMFATMYFFVNSRKHKIVSGSEEMIGGVGIAVDDFVEGKGIIRIHGERWQARCEHAVSKEDQVVVREMDGLFLVVESSRNESSDEE